jgi:hypothetical protein
MNEHVTWCDQGFDWCDGASPTVAPPALLLCTSCRERQQRLTLPEPPVVPLLDALQGEEFSS